MNGASLAEIAEVLGHKTLQMVKRYAHLSEQHTASVSVHSRTLFHPSKYPHKLASVESKHHAEEHHDNKNSPANIDSVKYCQKTRRTPEQWKVIISEHETSSLTQRNFCQQQGVAYSSFTYWLKKLKKMDPDADVASTPLLVGIESKHSASSPSTASNNWDVELAFANGVVLRLRQH